MESAICVPSSGSQCREGRINRTDALANRRDHLQRTGGPEDHKLGATGRLRQRQIQHRRGWLVEPVEADFRSDADIVSQRPAGPESSWTRFPKGA